MLIWKHWIQGSDAKAYYPGIIQTIKQQYEIYIINIQATRAGVIIGYNGSVYNDKLI